MLVQVLVFPQVNFHLQVQKEGLVVLSMKELDMLMKSMDYVLRVITSRGYSVKTQVILDGVTT